MRKDLWSSLFWVLFAVYFSIESYRLGLGRWSMPGPGYFPFGAAVIFGGVSLSVLIEILLKEQSKEVSIAASREKIYWWNLILIMVAMFTYILLFNKVGFVLCTFLLLFFLMRVVSRERWIFSLITASMVAATSHLLFNILLNAGLPRGFLGF